MKSDADVKNGLEAFLLDDSLHCLDQGARACDCLFRFIDRAFGGIDKPVGHHAIAEEFIDGATRVADEVDLDRCQSPNKVGNNLRIFANCP